MVADLHPKKEPKPLSIPPKALAIIACIILFILMIALAWANKGAYFYNTPLS